MRSLQPVRTSCVKQLPILSRVQVGMTIPMEKSATFARGTSSKCLVTRSSLNGRISDRNAFEGAKRSFGYSLSVIGYRLSVVGRRPWPDYMTTDNGTMGK